MHPATSLLSLLLLFPPPPGAGDYFQIKVIDADSGRGVPLVELKTVHNIRHFTDSNGIAAFREPGLMDQSVFFYVKSHGYEFARDGFGFAGKQLNVTAGGSTTLKIKRLNIAERLYRVTGAGIYADSELTGEPVPIKKPLLNAKVLGQDSVVNAIYKDKIYWFWGDTSKPAYPLGNFHVPGATSLLPKDGGLDPDKGVDLTYFVDKDGFATPTAKLPGKGPTWINGLVVLNDPNSNQERLFAPYMRIEGQLTVYERGLVEFNDATKEFEKRVQFDMKAPVHPQGHPVQHTDQGVEYVYFCHPYPLVRVRATSADLQDLSKYQTYSCFKKGSRAEALQFDRDAGGKLRWGWKSDTAPLTPKLQADLIKSGKMKAEEGLFQLQDADTGKKFTVHGGSVYWNAYRQRWVMIVLEILGTSVLGEIWYAEADTLLGPWLYARKVVTHDKYSFYNPKQHPMFDKKGGQHIYFEGTYTTLFSGNTDPTPRYDYNQIMYRLDLADPRLNPPVAVYQQDGPGVASGFFTRQSTKAGPVKETIAFHALDRPATGAVAVRVEKMDGGAVLQVGKATDANDTGCAFFALPASAKNLPKTAVPLYEWLHKNGKQRRYAIDADAAFEGFARQPQPVCYVWRN